VLFLCLLQTSRLLGICDSNRCTMHASAMSTPSEQRTRRLFSFTTVPVLQFKRRVSESEDTQDIAQPCVSNAIRRQPMAGSRELTGPSQPPTYVPLLRSSGSSRSGSGGWPTCANEGVSADVMWFAGACSKIVAQRAQITHFASLLVSASAHLNCRCSWLLPVFMGCCLQA
jgi:hypothetical protein